MPSDSMYACWSSSMRATLTLGVRRQSPKFARRHRRAPVDETLRRYAEARRARYRALHHFWRFGRGWLARVDKTLARAADAR